MARSSRPRHCESTRPAPSSPALLPRSTGGEGSQDRSCGLTLELLSPLAPVLRNAVRHEDLRQGEMIPSRMTGHWARTDSTRQRQTEQASGRLQAMRLIAPVGLLLEQLRPAAADAAIGLATGSSCYDHYLTLLLLYLFNPSLDSLRALHKNASNWERVQRKLGIPRVSLGSLSESVGVFDPALVRPIFKELARQARSQLLRRAGSPSPGESHGGQRFDFCGVAPNGLGPLGRRRASRREAAIAVLRGRNGFRWSPPTRRPLVWSRPR